MNSRNVAENNPQLKDNDCGMQILGSDFSEGKQNGKRHRMAFVKKILKLFIQMVTQLSESRTPLVLAPGARTSD